MTNDRRTYSGASDMVRTAAGGREPSEHQGEVSPDAANADLTPSEHVIPESGSEQVAEDVAVTKPGSGTSVSGAGGTAASDGTMTQGTWGVTPRPKRKT